MSDFMSRFFTASRTITHEERSYTVMVMETRGNDFLGQWVAEVKEEGRAHGQRISYPRAFSAQDSEEALDSVEKWFREDWKRDKGSGLLWNIRLSPPTVNGPKDATILIDEYTGETR